MHPKEGLVKLIYSSTYDSTVDVGVRLIEDPRQLTKSAATIFNCDYADLVPDKEHVGIHLVALGDFEHFGSNRNGDSFPKVACANFHPTFVKNGNVYRHHRNKDPEKRLGQVVKSAYNEPMGRVELFVHAHKEKAHDELEKLAKDGDIPFSMACFRAGTLVVASTGIKPIEVVELGELVLTHTGKWQKVGNRSVRSTDQYLRVSLVSWGRTQLEITANHEVFAASFYDLPRHVCYGAVISKVFKRAHRHELHKYAVWLPAGQLTTDHYMLVPIDRCETEQVDVNWARVLGYYIAEGSVSPGTVTFTCGIDDDAVRELPGLAPWTSTTIKPKANSDKAVSVLCFGTELRDRIEDLCGRRGENKRIPLLIQHAGAEAKFNFVAAWFNGAGWQDKDGLHWSTHYQGLAIELQRLLASVNIPSSCTRIDHPVDRGIIVSEDAIEYVVTASNQYSDLFAPICKAGELELCGDTKCRTFISGDYLCVPVKEIELIKETCNVYNFSVEGDESYTAYGMAVHNCKVAFDRCSICNTLRKSSSDPEQCDHVRLNLGKVGEDGRVTCTHNDEPNFFDISFVSRPADRIAWHLKAASNEVIDSVKLAEAEGLWIPDHIAIVSPDATKKLEILKKMAETETLYANLAHRSPTSTREYYIWEMRKAATAKFDDSTLDSFREYDPQELFYNLAKAGTVMDVESFFKYALGNDYAEVTEAMPAIKLAVKGVYGRLLQNGECQNVCNDRTFDVHTDTYAPIKSAHLVKAAEVTFIGPTRDQRVIDATINNLEIAIDTIDKMAFNSDLTIGKLAERYAAYKLSAVRAISALNKDTDTDALIAVATAQNLVG